MLLKFSKRKLLNKANEKAAKKAAFFLLLKPNLLTFRRK